MKQRTLTIGQNKIWSKAPSLILSDYWHRLTVFFAIRSQRTIEYVSFAFLKKNGQPVLKYVSAEVLSNPDSHIVQQSKSIRLPEHKTISTTIGGCL